MALLSRSLLPALIGLCLSGLPGGASAPSVVTGEISFGERSWARGSLPTLTFTVSAGRGNPTDKVAAFVHFSEEPGAFYDPTPYPPTFVGLITVPGSATVVVHHPLERGPINPHSHEGFVQGSLRDWLTGELLHVTNEEYLDIVYETGTAEFNLDFETEDDGSTPLLDGQDLSTPPEFGNLVSLDSLQPTSGPHHFGPAIFDSDSDSPNAFGDDLDLLVDSGNVLILQENGQQERPGFFKPDDAANGGTLVFDFTGFDFTEQVEPVSIDLIDIDLGSPNGATVILTDVLDHTRVFSVPAGWTEDITREGPPGVRTLDLTTLDPQPGFLGQATVNEMQRYVPGEVVRMEVVLGGSGAVDNIVFRQEAGPAGGGGKKERNRAGATTRRE
jgi:hypothetical protein